jgi:hypothetical protein
VNSKRKYNEVYESKHHEKWNRFFMELKDYKEKNGHCNTPTRNGSLGTWISYQRVLFRSKKLMTENLWGLGLHLRMRDSHPIMRNGIDASWSLWSVKKRMDIVIPQSRMDRLGAGSRIRGYCSDPRNLRRIVMKN